MGIHLYLCLRLVILEKKTSKDAVAQEEAGRVGQRPPQGRDEEWQVHARLPVDPEDAPPGPFQARPHRQQHQPAAQVGGETRPWGVPLLILWLFSLLLL